MGSLFFLSCCLLGFEVRERRFVVCCRVSGASAAYLYVRFSSVF